MSVQLSDKFKVTEMRSEESKNRFISSSEAKGKSRSAYYTLLKSVREGNMVCIRRGVYATMEQLADTMQVNYVLERFLKNISK